jgi:hypothetical protein
MTDRLGEKIPNGRAKRPREFEAAFETGFDAQWGAARTGIRS